MSEIFYIHGKRSHHRAHPCCADGPGAVLEGHSLQYFLLFLCSISDTIHLQCYDFLPCPVPHVICIPCFLIFAVRYILVLYG